MWGTLYGKFIELALEENGLVFFSGWMVAWLVIIVATFIVKGQYARAQSDREYYRKRHEELEATTSEVIRGVTESLTKVSEKFATLELLLVQILGRRNGINGG